jgi:hypothetical protein
VDINPLVAAMTVRLLAARLAHRIIRERVDNSVGKPKRFTTGGLAASVCVALGSIGLTLVGVMVLVQHKAPSPASVVFVLLLLIGILDHARSSRNADRTDGA